VSRDLRALQRIGKIRVRLDGHAVAAEALKLLADREAQPLNDRNHRDDGCDTDHDAERRQKAPKAVRANRAERCAHASVAANQTGKRAPARCRVAAPFNALDARSFGLIGVGLRRLCRPAGGSRVPVLGDVRLVRHDDDRLPVGM
jgi:hypothetical protein